LVSESQPTIWPGLQAVVRDLLREVEVELARSLLAKTLDGVMKAAESGVLHRMALAAAAKGLPHAFGAPRAYLSGPPAVKPSSMPVSLRTWLDTKSLDLARQLCLEDQELLRAITPEDLLACRRDQQDGSSPVRVKAMIEHFNKLSMWAATKVVTETKVQGRKKVVLRLVSLMEQLAQLLNFNSLLAILSGLDNAAVHRLRLTLDAADTKMEKAMSTMEKYRKLMERNFRGYRTIINEVRPPLVPYLGVHLSDLTFIHMGNPDLVEDPRHPGTPLIYFRKVEGGRGSAERF
jgi:hypothetical protein